MLLWSGLFLVAACSSMLPSGGSESIVFRQRRAMTTSDHEEGWSPPRKMCSSDEHFPPSRTDTTERLKTLRAEMKRVNVSAYLVPSTDAHQSEYLAQEDRRRQFISGFTGSAGLAVVLEKDAALWTDSRYFYQADEELGCNWKLMREGEPDTPEWWDWLRISKVERVGCDPLLVAAPVWEEWRKQLAKKDIDLVAIEDNLVDKVWTNRTTEAVVGKLEIHDEKYNGKAWTIKVREVLEDLEKNGFDGMVVTALDELAWLFNMRGKDLPYTPFFKGYSILTKFHTLLYIHKDRHTDEIKNHLNNKGCQGGTSCVIIRDYADFLGDLGNPDTFKQAEGKILVGKPWSYTGGASFSVFEALGERAVLDVSPIIVMKARKNKVETAGMINAHVRDAAAVIGFAAEMEEILLGGSACDSGEAPVDHPKEDSHGAAGGGHHKRSADEANCTLMNEIKAGELILKYRQAQELFQGESFQTISAYGAHAAIIAYIATEDTNKIIGHHSPFLIDSGAQYLDGTTDISRTFFYGQPSSFQIEAYTRVLMGSIDLARGKFKDGTTDARIDLLARDPLYRAGLDYRHGTGHGIGSYGGVHESPIQIRIHGKEEHKFEEGNFFTDEPGVYIEGEFGIRLETVVRVARIKLPYDDRGFGPFWGLEPVTLVPFEYHMINFTLMDDEQKSWFNRYNQIIRGKVGPVLKQQKDMRGFYWMMNRTEDATVLATKKPRLAKKPATVKAGQAGLTVSFATLLSIILILPQL